LACAGGARADSAPGEYFYRNWRIDTGLPDNWVNTVLQDPQGYLWLGTMTGLVRFDGTRFQEIGLPPALAAAGENIRGLAQEAPGTFVLLPASGGVLRFRDGKFSRHPVDAVVRNRTLQQIFAAPDGALWLADSEGRILRWKAGETAEFGKNDGLTNDLFGAIFTADRAGRTWVAEGGFLGVYESGRLQPSPAPPGGSLTIAPANDGGLWISSDTQLAKWRDGRLEIRAPSPDWTLDRSGVHRLLEDSGGVLWIATRRGGLYQLAEGGVRPVPTGQQRLTSLAEDAEGGIWVASSGSGISRVQRRRFALIAPEGADADAASTAVCEDARGAIWCADRSNGVIRFTGGRAETVPSPATDSFSLYANSVYPDGAGHVWIGATSGLYRADIAGPPAMQRINPQLRDIHVLFLSREGDLWISSGYVRLGRLHAGRYEAMTAEQGYPGKFVNAIAQTADGTVWLASEHALYSYAAGRLVPQAAVTAFPSERINTLYGDPAGALWIGTSHGLLRLKDGALFVFSRAQGLPNERIEALAEDRRSVLWLGSRQGYFHVARSDLEAVAAGSRARVDAVTFGSEEGMKGEVPVTNCEPNAWRSRDGGVLFCTQLGVVRIDANAVPTDLPSPPVYVDRVTLDGHPLASAGLRIPEGRHRLAFTFASPSFAAPEKVRLRYRLGGFDSDWIETASDQEAVYAGLAPGRYLLEVAASDPAGVWRAAPGASLAFTVVPIWWKTRWARLAALAVFAGNLAWLVRRGSHRRLKRRLERIEQAHTLEKERARIARDLHDDLGGSLTQIGLLADRLRHRAENTELEPGLGQLTERTRRLAGELESIVWTVNPQNDSLDRLAAFIRQFAQRFFRDTPIRCTVSGADDVPRRPITPEVQHHLLSATKEALNNALKHSRAGSVAVELGFEQGVFRTVIRDDGAGFDPEAAENSERNGLNNLRQRLREAGGTLEIRSRPGSGTVIAWSLPIAAPS
jgi:signal transduction histidine kinase/ligand-binding sensor domain-containing protein